jgi:hypothetical protein
LLYRVVINANIAVLEGWVQREREYKFLLGYLSAEMHGNPTKDRVQTVRLAVLMFIEPVIVLDAAISKVAEERLTGQPALFRDSTVKLAEQLQMATDLSRWFNRLAVEVGAAEVNPEELRNSLQSEADRRLSIWVSLARVEMLTLFGKTEEIQAAIDRHFLLVDPEPDKVASMTDCCPKFPLIPRPPKSFRRSIPLRITTTFRIGFYSRLASTENRSCTAKRKVLSGLWDSGP